MNLLLAIRCLADKLYLFFRNDVSFISLVFCFFLLFLFHILSSSILIEDLQLYFFPLFFWGVYYLAKKPVHRMPFIIVGAVCLLLIAIQAAGYFKSQEKESYIYISRLENDKDGLKARAFERRYNQVAATYELPFIKLRQQELGMPSVGKEWLAKNPLVPFLIQGQADWYQVVFPYSAKHYLDEFASTHVVSEIPTYMQNAAKSFALNLGRDVSAVQLEDPRSIFLVGLIPEFLEVPSREYELSSHFLSWLAKGLELHESSLCPSSSFSCREAICPVCIAERRDAFYEASDILGAWKSAVPTGFAYFLLATIDLLSALETVPLDNIQIDFALRRFAQSASKVNSSENGGVYELLFNNAGVAVLANGKTTENLSKARNWFERAANEARRKDRIHIGSKAAMINLITLDIMQSNGE